MRFQASRETLLQSLQLLTSVVERKQTWMLLNNILIEAEDERLKLTSTDMEVELVTSVAASVEQTGISTLSARKWLDICRNLPEEALIDVSISETGAILVSGKSRFNLAVLPHDDFPRINSIDEVESINVEQHELRELIEKTYFSMAQNDVRYSFNGILLELTGSGARAVATDGHRLALADTSSTIRVQKPHQVIVPRKGVHELLRMLGNNGNPAQVKLGRNHLRVEIDPSRITSKLIDGNYPDYNKVFPSHIEKKILVDREKFRQAITRVLVLSSEKSKGIRLSIESNMMQVGSHNQEHEEALDELEVDYSGEAIDIGFNGSYILDAIGAMDADKVEISIGENNGAGIFQGFGDESARYVIMPMRL